MHPILAWLLTVAWPLEDAAFNKMTQDERDDWNACYQRLAKMHGVYCPFAQTCWY
jgi:hypothetical protein